MEEKKPGTEVALTPRAKTLTEVQAKLADLLQKQVDALPKNFNQTRFLQNFLTVLNDTKDIEKCTPMSIVRVATKGAYLGLDFFRRECYAIVYGDQCNFQTDYKGEIKLAKKYSQTPIKDIYAKLVREGDELEIRIEAGKQVVNFRPVNFNDKDIVGVIAVIYFEDGSMLYDSMSKKEIEATRKDYSKAPNSPAWAKSWGEQAKKTVLRRLCKLIDLDFDSSEQDEAYNEGGDADLHKDIKPDAPVVADPFKDGVKPQAEEATLVNNAEEEAKKALRVKFPGEEEWQIDARYKEGQRA